METVFKEFTPPEKYHARGTLKMLPEQTESQIDQIYARIKDAEKKRVQLLLVCCSFSSLVLISPMLQPQTRSIYRIVVDPLRHLQQMYFQVELPLCLL